MGGRFYLVTRSKELVSQHPLPRGRIPFIESHSFLERVCCSTSSGQERLRGLSVLEKEQIIIFDSRTYSRLTKHCALIYAIEVVNITDEPALVAELG